MEFKDRFDFDETSGARLYRTDACCNRHNQYTRTEIDTTPEEDVMRSGYYGRTEYRKELNDINKAELIILKIGQKIPNDMSVTEFIDKHIEVLNG